MGKPAKKTTKRRMFFVALNTDELSIHMDNLMDAQGKADFLDGLYRGARNVELDPATMSKAFQRGYEFGSVAYKEASEAFARSREAGKKSAAIRAERDGTAQPTGRRTESRSEDRTPFDKTPNPLRQNAEPGDDFQDEDDDFPSFPHSEARNRLPGWNPGLEFNRTPKGVRDAVR